MRRAAVDKSNRRADQTPGQNRRPGHARSRKGWYVAHSSARLTIPPLTQGPQSSECRKRKIKCDETHPQCGQCRRAGRSCPILDSLFRQHALTFSVPAAAETAEQAAQSNTNIPRGDAPTSSPHQTSPQQSPSAYNHPFACVLIPSVAFVDAHVSPAARPAGPSPIANEPGPRVTDTVPPDHAPPPAAQTVTNATGEHPSPNTDLNTRFANAVSTPIWPERKCDCQNTTL